jgi:hypothetical protein
VLDQLGLDRVVDDHRQHLQRLVDLARGDHAVPNLDGLVAIDLGNPDLAQPVPREERPA